MGEIEQTPDDTWVKTHHSGAEPLRGPKEMWWACQYPEREPSLGKGPGRFQATHFWNQCPGCAVAYLAAIRSGRYIDCKDCLRLGGGHAEQLIADHIG
jgi:hypothetical protein